MLTTHAGGAPVPNPAAARARVGDAVRTGRVQGAVTFAALAAPTGQMALTAVLAR